MTGIIYFSPVFQQLELLYGYFTNMVQFKKSLCCDFFRKVNVQKLQLLKNWRKVDDSGHFELQRFICSTFRLKVVV
jgi:hypothetical protein